MEFIQVKNILSTTNIAGHTSNLNSFLNYTRFIEAHKNILQLNSYNILLNVRANGSACQYKNRQPSGRASQAGCIKQYHSTLNFEN